MKRILWIVGLLCVGTIVSKNESQKVVNVLKIKNNTGLTLQVQVYFLHANPDTGNQDRVFPCLHEVQLNEQMQEWVCRTTYMFPALPNLDKLKNKLQGLELTKAERTVGPYLDVEVLDKAVRVKPISQKRILPAGIYSIEKVSEQKVQVKESPITEITIEAVLQ
ncbi:hypothetical protein JW872_01615 [Candidatus Babeliales bacterium]|nr:hypothetical protein [Candidatus Babeliales bacterium]